ncbi:uncharacterized protein N7458_007424 [Penicillium daleae]|uniref:Uncharacterized protein n=1 Tax=Penicillium daleae TaxID=63821 RepID=A0AAD6C0K2_9EURO|nr:uncharacterized protein N7458_007424 [Penicillium daleae]KAJ5443552.1 hypothetical protein N7458_007424 [Penicillium daleae]
MSAGKGSTAEVGPGTDRASDGARLGLELMHDLLGTAETRQTGLVGKDQVQKNAGFLPKGERFGENNW